jgi:uncharacterized protein
MRLLKMTERQTGVAAIENPVWIERVDTVASPVTGIFYPLVKRGTYVQKGMKLGYVTDYVGARVAEPVASSSGVVLYVNALPTMKKDDTVANIGVVAEKGP